MIRQVEFVAPEEWAGRLGWQEMDDETGYEVSMKFEDGTDVPNIGYSYRTIYA